MPLPKDISSRDVVQWLQGGWFHVDKGTERIPTVCSFEEIRDSGQVRVIGTDGERFITAQSRIHAHWPICGALNIDGYAVVLNRESRQQYRRTYNSRCLTIDIPRKWDVMKAAGTEASVNPDTAMVVEAAFNPMYYSYSDALQRLAEGSVSVAMNPHLIIAGDMGMLLVYYRGTLVGKVEGTQMLPIGGDDVRLRRLMKFFDGRVTL